MFDMPAVVAEGFQQLDLGQLGSAVEDYAPALEVVKKTWDKESLLSILQGHIDVPDETINEALAARIDENSPVNSLTITSRENGRMDILADTKKLGRVELSGTVDVFVHDGASSYMTYTVKERALKDHGLLSWFFSRISLSMAEKLVGHLDLGDDLPTTVKGNSVTVDYAQILQESDLGRTSIAGCNLLDALKIKSAEPHEGYVTFQTALDVPDGVRSILLNILQ